jgi:hypothetical protein
MSSLKVVIVEKNGTLRNLAVKEFNINELYKKCGFKKSGDFIKQVNWSVKYEGQIYNVSLYAKTEGRHSNENKYEFPPPIDTKLFFGSCALVASLNDEYINLNDEMWSKMYNKLYGGFEDLSKTAQEDELEEDELENVHDKYKTKSGYLKDGFVVDSNSEDLCNGDEEDEEEEEEEEGINYLDNLDPELTEEEYVESDSELELGSESSDSN